MLKALEETGYNITKAAEKLKIKRQTLQHKMKKYKINENDEN
ncbi:helix-turn-helix domain-containing protein [Caloramator sp. Dgby_cultured_2]